MSEGKIKDVSHLHKRARQQTLVDTFRDLADKADKGEIVGALVIFVDNHGKFGFDRDMFLEDTPSYMGYMDLIKMRMIARYDPKLCQIFAEGVDE